MNAGTRVRLDHPLLLMPWVGRVVTTEGERVICETERGSFRRDWKPRVAWCREHLRRMGEVL